MREHRHFQRRRTALRHILAGAVILAAAAAAMTLLESTDDAGSEGMRLPEVRGAPRVVEAAVELPWPQTAVATRLATPGTLVADAASWTLCGLVVEDDRRALEGATIEAGDATARSGADGVFELQVPRPGGPLRILASAPGYCPREIWLSDEVEPGADTTLPALVLPRHAGLAGRICRAEGGPIRDASVRVSLDSPRVTTRCFAGTAPESRRVAVLTDADGRFELDDLDVGICSLQASAEGFIDWCGDVELAPGKVADCGTFTFEARTSLEGRVVDAFGAAVAGASVLICRNKPMGASSDDHPAPAPVDDPGPGVTTDADGRFRFEGLGPGRWVVGAIPPATSAAWPGLAGAVAGPDAPPALVKLPGAPRRLEGHVLDAHDAPAIGVTISAQVLGLLRDVRSAETTVDAAGRFTLDVPPDVGLRVLAWSSDAGTAEVNVDPRIDSALCLRLRAPRPAHGMRAR